MIDEKATYEKFGYHSTDLKQKSRKKIIATCDDCGKARILFKHAYHARCNSCARKAERNPNFGKKGKNVTNWKGGKVLRICKECGTEFPIAPSKVNRGRGKFCSRRCQGKWQSKHQRGENHPRWKNGASFEPYCSKFNNEFKEYIRDKFGRVCFLCPKTEEENGQRLSVHHVNYNKDCGCDGDETCQFVPLCIGCNAKVNFNREMWEKKIKDMMRNKLNGWFI